MPVEFGTVKNNNEWFSHNFASFHEFQGWRSEEETRSAL
jgi:hypothetical protein